MKEIFYRLLILASKWKSNWESLALAKEEVQSIIYKRVNSLNCGLDNN